MKLNPQPYKGLIKGYQKAFGSFLVGNLLGILRLGNGAGAFGGLTAFAGLGFGA